MAETLETNQDQSEIDVDPRVKSDFFENLEDQSRFVALLKTAGIVSARIHYNGGGDDGSVDDDAEFFDANSKKVKPPPGLVRIIDSTGWGDPGEVIEADLHKAVQTMCYRALDLGEWDWINNEGGYGTLYIDFTVSPFSIRLEHNQRVESVEEHELEW